MKEKRVVLSKRLQMLADMVTRGNRVADVGCDHGFLSIRLVQDHISPSVLAMDVRKGPLAAAVEHIAGFGLGEYIETRLSDGLQRMEAGETDALVCAGMGGRLMEKILTDSMEKVRGMKELILQPQSEIKEFRAFLRMSGFKITEENAVYEEGKFYFAMKAVYGAEKAEALEVCRDGEQNLFDEYGELLLRQKNPVLKQYLLFRRGVAEQLAEKVSAENTERAAVRLEEIKNEQGQIQKALRWFSD